jgi:hypothetical protein
VGQSPGERLGILTTTAVSPGMAATTLSSRVSTGLADIEARKHSTAYAQFTRKYQEMVAEYCSPHDHRNRELDASLSS